MGEGMRRASGLCAGPGLEAAAQFTQRAHVGTEVTCPLGWKAEPPPILSLSEWLALACSRGKDARDIRPLLACLPASSYPCPWTPAARAASLQNSVPTFPRDVACFGIRRAWF